MDRIFKHVVAIADAPGLLALGKQRTVRSGRVERADARAGGANALGERALGNQLELDFARAVCAVEMPGIGLTRKRAENLAHALCGNERREARIAVARVIVDDGEAARPLCDQRVDQCGRHPRVTEATDHDRGAVGDVGERRLCAGEGLIDHRKGAIMAPAPLEEAHSEISIRH